MTTLLYFDEVFLEHDTGLGHPERSDRLRSIIEALETPRFASLTRRQPRDATVAEIERVHRPAYVETILASVPEFGSVAVDADTVLSPGSGIAAIRAAGALLSAVDAIMAGQADRAFCAVRPPGHHAEPARGMGFCIFNNVAIGAAHALAAHGLERVAIVDFDVHHGNGTQAAFYDKPAVLFGCSHQMPLYPGTGAPSETGSAGTILNVPLSPGDGGAEFRTAMQGAVLPRIAAFEPDLLLISAGFDAHMRDPLAQLNLVEDDFAWATRALMDVADATCDGRVVSVLEGGYDLTGLSRSVAVHVKTLMTA